MQGAQAQERLPRSVGLPIQSCSTGIHQETASHGIALHGSRDAIEVVTIHVHLWLHSQSLKSIV